MLSLIHILGDLVTAAPKNAPKYFPNARALGKYFGAFFGAAVTKSPKMCIRDSTTFKGTPFNKNSLGKILHNRRYIGDYVWGDIVVAGGMPQIVDRDLWERVQAKLSRKEKASARARGDYNYILSGKLFCGKCGKGMIGDHGTSRNGAKFYYYTCSTKKHGGSCSKKSVRAEKIEAEAVSYTHLRIRL